jgi:hypothetical protein
VRTACVIPSSTRNLNRNGADLCQKIRDNDRLTHAGHSEQDAVLRFELRTGVFKDLERIKWYLWHGKVSLNVSASPTPSGGSTHFFVKWSDGRTK